jgi:putative aldouronate transport system substrate-binding protein
MKKSKNIISGAALCLMVICAACSPKSSTPVVGSQGGAVQGRTWTGDPNLNPPGETPICKEKVSLTIAMPTQVYVEDYETNYMTLKLEEEGNMDLSFIMYPAEDYRTKMDLMVAAGGRDLPDIIASDYGRPFTDAQVFNYALAGAIVPLTDYFENSGYYIPDTFKRASPDDDLFKYIKSPDGNMYYVPIFNQSLLNECYHRIFLYKPWLDKLNLKIPVNTDEFLEVMRAFRNRDPNGNGIKDEIPITWFNNEFQWSSSTAGLVDTLMTPFVYANGPDYWNVDNKKLSVAFMKEEWRRGLRYLRTLVQEELLSPLAITQDRTQYAATLTNQTPLIGMVIESPTYIPGTNPRRADFMGIPPLAGPSGTVTTVYRPSMPLPGMMITKNCKNPEAAFRLGDLMCQQKYGIAVRYGWEELGDWKAPSPDDKSLYAHLGYKPLLVSVLNWSTLQNHHWYQQGPFMRTYDIAAGVVVKDDPLNTSYLISKILGEYRAKIPSSDKIVAKLIYTIEEQEELNELQTTIQSYLQEATAKFITGAMSIDNDWDNYLTQLKAMGVERVIEIGQAAYTRMNP